MTHTPMTPEELDARTKRAIAALRMPDSSLVRVPNTIRQSIAEVIEDAREQAKQNRHDAALALEKWGQWQTRAEQAEAEIERLESEATGLTQGVFVDPGANPVVSWKSRAEQAEAEIERLRKAITEFFESERKPSYMRSDKACVIDAIAYEELRKALTPMALHTLVKGYNTRAEQAEAENERLREAIKPFVDGFKSDPGTSDLDNEQPITIRMTLGDWRKLRSLGD